MSRSESSSLKWLKPFIGGLGESLSDRTMTSSSSEDGGRFSLFILLDINKTMPFQKDLIYAALILDRVDTELHQGLDKMINQIKCMGCKTIYIDILPSCEKITSRFPLIFILSVVEIMLSV